MLDAIKHITDDNFFFQEDSAPWHVYQKISKSIHVCQSYSKPKIGHFLRHGVQWCTLRENKITFWRLSVKFYSDGRSEAGSSVHPNPRKEPRGSVTELHSRLENIAMKCSECICHTYWMVQKCFPTKRPVENCIEIDKWTTSASERLFISRYTKVHFIIIKPHCSTTWCGLLLQTDSVVCRSVTIVSLAKTAEPIEMPFEILSRVDPRNHVLDGVHIVATWRIWINMIEPSMCGGDAAFFVYTIFLCVCKVSSGIKQHPKGRSLRSDRVLGEGSEPLKLPSGTFFQALSGRKGLFHIVNTQNGLS